MSNLPKTGNSLLLPTTTNSISLPTAAAAQSLKSSSSATGNPRNKCALKPGHSLMDWIRLGNSGADLAGTRGRTMPVSSDELAKHNTQHDAWMAIRGKVYNVTRYMDFHPGGVDELMRGVGRDATKLFDDVHAWVNYQQLLAKCYIGPLTHVVKLDTTALKALKMQTSNDFSKLPPLPAAAKPQQVTPRFDWIQKRHELTLYIYTSQFCNPGLLLQSVHDKHLRMRVLIAHTLHEYNLELQQALKWPPKHLRIASESGKIELSFEKCIAELWTTYGSYTSSQLPHADELRYEQKIAAKTKFNHDSFDLVLEQASEKLIIQPPLGYHIGILMNINSVEVTRSYTPIPAQYLQSLSEPSEQYVHTKLCFLIKSYEHGMVSAQLQQREVGAVVQITPPKGNFVWANLTKHRQIVLLAAGSGITPLLTLLAPLLQRATNRLETLALLYFNKTAQDIWCRKQLDQLAQADARFQVQYVLSQADGSSWTGPSGRLHKQLLLPYFGSQPNQSAAAIYALVCGPDAFNQLAQQLLTELNVQQDCMHVFQ